jgi:hypothetical protein
MVPTNQTFFACATYRQIFPKLHGLVDVPIAVTEICGLIRPNMDAKAFGRAAYNSCQ